METINNIKLGVYSHYKNGDKYLVYDVTIDEETLEPRISYHSLEDYSKRWSRPENVFFENIDKELENNNTGQEVRFVHVENYEMPIVITKNITQENILSRKTCFDEIYEKINEGDLIKIIIFGNSDSPIIGRVKSIQTMKIVLDVNKTTFKIPMLRITELYKIIK